MAITSQVWNVAEIRSQSHCFHVESVGIAVVVYDLFKFDDVGLLTIDWYAKNPDPSHLGMEVGVRCGSVNA